MKRSLSINKSVLNGFLSQAISHNRFLEESEMWKKKRELEEADKASKRPCPSSCRPADSPPPAPPGPTSPEDIDDLKVLLALYKDVHKKPEEKWDHGGFRELYPEAERPTSPAASSEENRRHSKHKKEKKKSSKKKKKKEKKKKRRKE